MSRSLAERLTERVELAYADRQWPVIFTHEALLEIEEVSHKSILDGELDLFQPSASTLRSILTVLLGRAGCKITNKEAGTFLRPARRVEVQTQILKAWRAAMPEPEPERDDDKPKGERQFHRNWMAIWADNKQNLGIGYAEWLESTPRMMQYLSRERLDLVRQNELMLSGIRAAIINHGAAPAKEYCPEDRFMLHPFPKKKQAEEVTGDYIQRVMSPYFRLLRERK